MKRREFEATLRAAARISGEREFVVIGSPAIHAICRRPPAEVLISQECDLYPLGQSQKADLLHRELGRESAFARRHGFYADVVTPDFASLPDGWEARLVRLLIGRICALCLDRYDLVVSKLVAGRLKDLEFVGALVKLRLCRAQGIARRIGKLPFRSERTMARQRLGRVLEDLRSSNR